jgi:multiple sugar transport system substrate-binding protein
MKLGKVLLSTALVGSLLLSGCGNSEEKEDTAKQANKEIVLDWVAHPAYSLQSSDPKRVEYLTNSIEEFENSNANVKIEPNVLSSNIPEAMAKLLEQASQGRAPDIAQIDSYIFPRYVEYLQPLDELLEEHGITIDDFFPFAQQTMTGPDGKIYGIQFTTDTRVLYYRKDLVKTPPTSWDDLLEIGSELKGQGYDTLLFPGGRGEGMTVTSFLPFFWAQGGKLVDEEGNAVFGEGENREAALNTLSFIEKLVNEGLTAKRVANYGSESDLNSEVAAGKVAMFLGGNWQVNQLRDILGEEEFSKWAVAPIPQFEGAEAKTTAGGWTWGIFTEDPEEQKAAVEFLASTFVGDEGMANWTTIGGYLPTRKSVYELEGYEKNEFTETFKDHLNKYAQNRPSAPVYSDISAQLQIAVSSVVSGGKTPEEALDEAWTSVKK